MKEDYLNLHVITSVFRGHKAKIDVDVEDINIHRKHTFEYALLYKEYHQNIQHLAKSTAKN